MLNCLRHLVNVLVTCYELIFVDKCLLFSFLIKVSTHKGTDIKIDNEAHKFICIYLLRDIHGDQYLDRKTLIPCPSLSHSSSTSRGDSKIQ